MGNYTLVTGDCLEALRAMEAESVDAVVTDPPYGLRFMGQRWDYDVPSVDVFREVLRVLKDGGRLLCFAGARTMHRMWVNIEDAGFTIEDTIAWMYGSGFPKHKSKLKPAYEPICVARKGGTMHLNIDACRIGTSKDVPASVSQQKPNALVYGKYGVETGDEDGHNPTVGRWPANVALDGRAAELLDQQSGVTSEKARILNRGRRADFFGKDRGRSTEGIVHGDFGGASRFYYTAKASRAEREAGLEGMEQRPGGSTAKGFTEDVERGVDRNRPVANPHPTVKPVDLMRWLVRLVAKPGETILDPFMGSGTTGVACTLEGVHFIGIDREGEYVEIARRRIANTQPSLFTPTGDEAS